MESITLQPSEKQIQDFVAQYQAQLVSSKNPYIRAQRCGNITIGVSSYRSFLTGYYLLVLTV